MSNTQKERIESAQKGILDILDYITDCYPTPDFVEIAGRVGGDTVTYRVYDDGSMYERYTKK